MKSVLEHTHVCMTGIYHDAIERYALLGESKGQFKVFRVSRMIQVNRDRYAGLMCS